MLLQGCFQALNLSTHRSIIGRSTAQHMIRTVVLIHLGVISSFAHLCRAGPQGKAASRSLKRPWGLLRPVTHRVRCPCSRLVFMTGCTSIRDLVFLCHCWRDELEGVCAHEGAGDALGLDLGHMAGYALTPWAAVLVMSMKLHAGYVWTIRRRCTVAVKADLVNRLTKLRIVFSPVYVMTRCANDAPPVHHALNKVIALHPIFVSGPIRKMRESRLPQCVIFELPIVRKTKTGAVPYGPVVRLAFDLL